MTLNQMVAEIERARAAMSRAGVPIVLIDESLRELRATLVDVALEDPEPPVQGSLLLQRQAG